ncbi:MAG: cation-transporting P-type ATPase [bacterium]|nr:cation-transporting P-type ATPase [bacterium]
MQKDNAREYEDASTAHATDVVPLSAAHAMDVAALAEKLGADVTNGLTSEDAERRLTENGHNVIMAEEGRSVFAIVIAQIKNPIVYVLLVAAVVSLVLGESLDAIAIAIVLAINTGIGFYLEFQAERSMQELKDLSATKAVVWRAGERKEIDATEVVLGDVVLLEEGYLVPADGRIVELAGLQVNESSLTGESIPVDKSDQQIDANTQLADRTCMVYGATHVTRGRGRILITATGMHTEVGRIAELVGSSDQSTTPLEKKLQSLSIKMIAITVVIAGIVLVSGLASGRQLMEIVTIMLALSVAAIPEGLPIVATIALASGALRMARRNVIVKQLSSVETIGSADVICTDKTGTLTENRVGVESVVTANATHLLTEDALLADADAAQILTAGFLCNNAVMETANASGDPIEVALRNAAVTAKLDTSELLQRAPRIAEEPFSSETKVMATLHQREQGFVVYAKGATEELLKYCTSSSNGAGGQEKGPSGFDAQRWLDAEHQLAANGFRVLGFATADFAQKPQKMLADLMFIGLVGMVDPLRADVKPAIQECIEAGIRVIMITGDHPATALKIGKELGIETADRVVTGSSIDGGAWDDERLTANVFARVNPEHKLALVTALQEQDSVVVMTGDGINDTPALRKADVGVAMGQRGVAVAKEVADVVIKDDAFTSIVAAVREGRIIFDNIRAFVIYLLSGNLSELLVIGATAVMNVPFQLVPLQILFINLLSDVLPALALAFTEGRSDIMRSKPHGLQDPLVASRHWRAIVVYGIVIASCSMGAVVWAGTMTHDGNSVLQQNNVFFFTLVLSQMIHVFNMGGRNRLSRSVLRNRYVWAALGMNVVLIALAHAFVFTREVLSIQTIGFREWLVVIAFSLLSFIVNYLAKRVLARIKTAP